MKIIDKDEIKIEYERRYGDTKNTDEIVEVLYQKRLQMLINFEKEQNLISDVSYKNLHKSHYSMDKSDNLNKTKTSFEDLLTSGYNNESNKLLLEEERKKRNRPRWLLTQYFLLTWMFMYEHYRKSTTYLVVLAQIFLGNAIFMLVFKNLGDPKDDTIVAIQNRIGFCYLMNLQGTMAGINSSILNFITSRKIFNKDKDARLYSELPFYMAQLTYMIPIYLILFIGLTFIYYYVIGLNSEPSLLYNALKTYFFMFVGGYISGQSFSVIIGSICDSMSSATAMIPIIVAPLSMSAGYLSNLKTAALPIQWIAYISSMRFAYQGYTLTEFQNSQVYRDSCMTYINCPDDPSKRCHIKVPEYAKAICDPMLVTDFVQTDIYINMYFILGLIVVFRFFGFVLFKFRSSRGKIKYKKNNILKKILKKKSII